MHKTLLAVIALLIAAFGGFMLSKEYGDDNGDSAESSETTKDLEWAAAAPGRVEPKSGEIKIGTALVGRVAEVYVSVNDKVEEGQLLIKLDDAEARARLASAETAADSAEKARNDQNLSSSRKDVREAEDEVYFAERAVTGARIELDYAFEGKRAGTVTERTLSNARRRLENAQERVKRGRLAVARAQAKSNLPAPGRFEAAVSEARAKVAIAEALLDKTRIRAPRAGTVLQLRAKTGEMVAPSPGRPLVMIGDMSVMRVMAEVDEVDVSKIKLGQKVTIKSASYPGREFSGTVAELAPSLSSPEIMQRGPRRATDVEVLEVSIELDGDVPLLPGMRADAFFHKS